MPERTRSGPEQYRVPVTLRELAQSLRTADHLGSEAQEKLASLIEELSGALEDGTLTNEEQARLKDYAAQLAHALHQKHETGLPAAKQRLEEAIMRLEVKAPLVTGIARQLIEVLANM